MNRYVKVAALVRQAHGPFAQIVNVVGPDFDFFFTCILDYLRNKKILI